MPLKAIAVTIPMLLGTALLLLAWKVMRVLAWIVVAAFLAVVIGPAVDVVERRLHLARTLATLLVFVVGVLALAGLITVMVRPLARESADFATQVPSFVAQARSGHGPVGRLVKRYHLDQYVQRNQAQIRETVTRFSRNAFSVPRGIFATVAALLAILVLAFLMVLQGPKLLAAWLSALPPPRRERVRHVAADSSKAITVAALHSPMDGLILLAFFIAYQQFENHGLQPVVLSRTVELSALTVLVGLLIGVELAGFLGALLAIPGTGVCKVIWRDLYDNYHGRLKPEPTIGADEIPASRAPPEMEPAEPGDGRAGGVRRGE